MKNCKQRLTNLNNTVNSKKRKSNSEGILLFIAEAVADNSKKLGWLVAAVTILIAILVALLVKG